eukprot:jgi/Ulvmu1/11293/UM074_0008.1
MLVNVTMRSCQFGMLRGALFMQVIAPIASVEATCIAVTHLWAVVGRLDTRKPMLLSLDTFASTQPSQCGRCEHARTAGLARTLSMAYLQHYICLLALWSVIKLQSRGVTVPDS